MHGIKHPAMDRFQAIPDIGDRPADNDTHGIVHIGLFHFTFDIDQDIFLVKILFHYFSLMILSGLCMDASASSRMDRSNQMMRRTE